MSNTIRITQGTPHVVRPTSGTGNVQTSGGVRGPIGPEGPQGETGPTGPIGPTAIHVGTTPPVDNTLIWVDTN